MRCSSLLALLVLSGAWGCGPTEPEPTEPSLLPTCAEHELALPRGECLRPGVPLDGCGEGFAHDGMYGCEAILPVDPCPPGLLAVPGDETCHGLMECGQSPWGDLPVDGTTVYVDGTYGGGDADGSEARPWPTIGQAVAAAPPGALVAVAAGTYGEGVVIDGKPVRLWGRCPEQVAIQAPAQPVPPCPMAAAVCILGGADGSEVGGLALRGSGVGIALSGSGDVLIERVHVHDNAAVGVAAQGTFGPTSMTLQGSLVEQNYGLGLAVLDANVTVDGSVVRTAQPLNDDMVGIGVHVQLACSNTPTGWVCDPLARARATLTRSVVEQNHSYGIYVRGSDLSLDGSVVRATWPCPTDQTEGRGVHLEPSCADATKGEDCDPATRSTAAVTRSLIEQNHVVGLYVLGSDATIDASVIRTTLPSEVHQGLGRGIDIAPPCVKTPTALLCHPELRPTASVTRSLIEQNHDAGAVALGGDLTVDASVVRTTHPNASIQENGFGIAVAVTCSKTAVGWVCDEAARGTATVAGTLVEQNHESGLFVGCADAAVDSSVVRTTWSRPGDGLYGDGVAVSSGITPGSATLTNVIVDDSARAGVAAFGAFVGLADTYIRCAAVPLNGQHFVDQAFELADHGGNRCGCPTPESDCKVVTADLQPPGPVAVDN